MSLILVNIKLFNLCDKPYIFNIKVIVIYLYYVMKSNNIKLIRKKQTMFSFPFHYNTNLLYYINLILSFKILAYQLI